MIRTHLAPYKQGKVFLNTVSISPRYSNFKKLWGVHHPMESDSAVCIIPQSQALPCASHRGVNRTLRSENLNLWESLHAFKGTIRRNPIRGELFYHERKDLKKKFDLLNLKFWLCGVMHTPGVEFFTICDRISPRNRNQIRIYISLFIRVPDRFESWKNIEVENLGTHSL